MIKDDLFDDLKEETVKKAKELDPDEQITKNLSDYCKKDLTHILVPKKEIADESGWEIRFIAKELDEATDEEIMSWAKYVCPNIAPTEVKFTSRESKITFFEAVVNYLVAIHRSWQKAMKGSNTKQ